MAEKRPAHEVIIDNIVKLVEDIEEYDLWKDLMVRENKELEFYRLLFKEIIIPDEFLDDVAKVAMETFQKCPENTKAWHILNSIVSDLNERQGIES